MTAQTSERGRDDSNSRIGSNPLFNIYIQREREREEAVEHKISQYKQQKYKKKQMS